MHIEEIPYQQNSWPYFNTLRAFPRPCWLDSNASERGRFDILSAAPYAQIQDYAGETLLNGKPSGAEPLAVLQALLLEKRDLHANAQKLDASALPFTGGAIGYLAYDLGRRYENIPSQAEADITAATASIGVYDWGLIVDHKLQRATVVGESQADVRRWAAQLRNSGANNKLARFGLRGDLQTALTENQYAQAFNTVQDYIRAGDCYQINLAQRYAGEYVGDPLELYLRLRERTQAPFSAYIGDGQTQLLSISPERFLQVRNGTIHTQPIKGTAARYKEARDDAASAERLLASEKDRAENLMIVDLLRNDLGRVCKPGSITVPEIFALQSFAAVHHLVSTIEGELRDDCDAIDALRAAFPGGSITGAPKLRAMEIIDELEPQRRSIYCGSLFYADFNGNLDSNILIRSILCHEEKVYCWGGGGLVADSTAEAEYREIAAKIGALLSTIAEHHS